MSVDRCICHDVPFEDLLAMVPEVGASFEALSARTRCGTGCGMCRPYILVMLKTGRTRLPVLTPAQVQRILAQPDSPPPTR